MLVANINVTNVSFDAIRKNKILAKVSDFTVNKVTIQFAISF